MTRRHAITAAAGVTAAASLASTILLATPAAAAPQTVEGLTSRRLNSDFRRPHTSSETSSVTSPSGTDCRPRLLASQLVHAAPGPSSPEDRVP